MQGKLNVCFNSRLIFTWGILIKINLFYISVNNNNKSVNIGKETMSIINQTLFCKRF